MIKLIGKVDLGAIKPCEKYEIYEIEGKRYLISIENLQNFKILGEVVDIISENDSKIIKYREQGYWPLKLEEGNRVAIINSLSIYEVGKIKQKILKMRFFK